MTDSISRRFARWSATLEYDALPEVVVDKVRAFLFASLVAGCIGSTDRRATDLLDLVKAEDARTDGARILGDGTRVTRTGAALANCELMHVSGMFDSYRMITHPGPVLVAVGLAHGEIDDRSFGDLVTALAAGYEMECRLADDFVPTIAAHGFRPAPIFSTVGAGLVSGKMLGLSEEGLLAAIAIATSSASGLNEPARAAGGESAVHEPNAARQGVFAGMMASLGHVRGSELAIEGPAGFFAAYGGSRDGALTYTFTGPRRVDLATITEDLGERYKLLDVMFRIYNGAGFNQPVIELLAEMRRTHGFRAEEIEEIVIEMNYLETLYPSPEFPRFPDPRTVNRQTTHYFAASVAVDGFFPVVGSQAPGSSEGRARDAQVEEFMTSKIRLLGVYDQPMFSPSVTVALRDGRSVRGTWPYERLAWGFDELVGRLGPAVPGLPGGQAQFDRIVEIVGSASPSTPAAALLDATMP
jgi:2-methylcitrate dehydratase PrpD